MLRCSLQDRRISANVSSSASLGNGRNARLASSSALVYPPMLAVGAVAAAAAAAAPPGLCTWAEGVPSGAPGDCAPGPEVGPCCWEESRRSGWEEVPPSEPPAGMALGAAGALKKLCGGARQTKQRSVHQYMGCGDAKKMFLQRSAVVCM